MACAMRRGLFSAANSHSAAFCLYRSTRELLPVVICQATRNGTACHFIEWDTRPEGARELGAGPKWNRSREGSVGVCTAPLGAGKWVVCGSIRGVKDDPGASKAGSGDWAFACYVASAAMLAASMEDTISIRFMVGPFTLTFVPPNRSPRGQRPRNLASGRATQATW
jgi:hypothetical protein